MATADQPSFGNDDDPPVGDAGNADEFSCKTSCEGAKFFIQIIIDMFLDLLVSLYSLWPAHGAPLKSGETHEKRARSPGFHNNGRDKGHATFSR